MAKKIRGILILVFTFSIFSFQNSSAQVKISEIAWMGTTGSSYDEWIELYNSGETTAKLDNFILKTTDKGIKIDLVGEIPAKSYFLLERTDENSVTNVPADQIYKGSLANSGETLILENDKGKVIDQTPNGDWVAGENSAKKTMERQNFILSGAESNAWQTFQNESSIFLDADKKIILGSPRKQNSGEIVFPITKKVEFIPYFSQVEISQITPILKDSNEIWLELIIHSDQVFDVSGWKISNDEEEIKLTDLGENLVIIKGQNFAGKKVYLSENGHVSVTQDEVGQNHTFPLGKMFLGSEKGEGFVQLGIKKDTLALGKERVFQILDERNNILASKNFAKDLEIIFSEIAPNLDGKKGEYDFFEVFAKKSKNPTNLKFSEFLHNGKVLFRSEEDLIIKKDDLLTFDLQWEKIQEKPPKYENTTFLQENGKIYTWTAGLKNNIVASSGTMEIILWRGTDWEISFEKSAKASDFVCWAQNSLNKTETKRLNQYGTKNWNGDCIKIKKYKLKETIARSEPQTDNNDSSDFFRHFHSSKGNKNFIKNSPPHAKIKMQKSGEFSGESKINFTGVEKDDSASTDADGAEDLIKFKWKINGKSCGNYKEDGWEWLNSREKNITCYLEAQKKNPSFVYVNFEQQESFEISLEITDLSGFKDETKIILKKDKEEIIKPKNIKLEFNYSKNEGNKDFFADFLANTDLEKLKKIAYINKPLAKIKPAPRFLFARDRFSTEEKMLMQKNIGLIFR